MLLYIAMWVVFAMFVGAVVLGYTFWTWNAAIDIVASVRDEHRFFPIEHETVTWLIVHAASGLILAPVLLEVGR